LTNLEHVNRKIHQSVAIVASHLHGIPSLNGSRASVAWQALL